MEKIYQPTFTTKEEYDLGTEFENFLNRKGGRRNFFGGLAKGMSATAITENMLFSNAKPLLNLPLIRKTIDHVKKTIEHEKQIKYNLDVLDRFDTALNQKLLGFDPDLLSDEEQISILCAEFNAFFENPLNRFQGDFFERRQDLFRASPETIRQNLWDIELYFSLCGFFSYIRLEKNYRIYEIRTIITEDTTNPRKLTANLPKSGIASGFAVHEPVPDDLIDTIKEYLPENTIDIHEIDVTHVLFPFYIHS